MKSEACRYRRELLGRGNRTHKDPEAGALLEYSRNSQDARMAGVQGARRQVADEAQGHWVVEGGACQARPYRCLKGLCLYLDLEGKSFLQGLGREVI